MFVIKSLIFAAVLALLLSTGLRAQDQDDHQPFLPALVRSVSTVPANGDVNPYGVAFVPRRFPAGGTINPGDILVSNFNNNQNLQGTGTTIVRVPPSAAPSLFFQGVAPLGLSTALTILRSGYVLVGNFPSVDGTCGTASPGSILVINSSGKEVSSIADSAFINGPWDSALIDEGNRAKLFVANGLSGTIARLNLAIGPGGVSVESATQIASGYRFQCDPATFVDAPTGLVYDAQKGVLYVASTLDNAVFAIHDAANTRSDQGTGTLIYEDAVHLHGALAMAMAPNGHLVVSSNDVVNADPNQPSELVEFTVEGQFVKEVSVDPNLGGSFGLAISVFSDMSKLAAVDDNTAMLLIWTLPLP
jgi:DNA-binding beta-propeller fold protein YncE